MPTHRTRVWTARALLFVAALAGVYVLGGGEWFFAGLCLGWLGAVVEVAAMGPRYPEFPEEADYDSRGGGPAGF